MIVTLTEISSPGFTIKGSFKIAVEELTSTATFNGSASAAATEKATADTVRITTKQIRTNRLSCIFILHF